MDDEASDRRDELCALIIANLQRCGIDARDERTEHPNALTVSVLTLSRGEEALIDFRRWWPARNCWGGILFRLADAELLLSALETVKDGGTIAALAVYNAQAKQISER